MDKGFVQGDMVCAKIEGVAFGGGGVGRIEGRVVFVPFTVDGDIVEAKVRTVKKKYLVADVQKLMHSSPHRVAPPCPFFASCGGCHYQHIDYAHELAIKRRQIVDAFERIGRLAAPPVEDIIPSPKMYRYRQKADFHCIPGKGGSFLSGFMGVDGHRIVEIDRCELLDESINEEYKKVRNRATMETNFETRMTFWSGVEYKAGDYITRQVKDKNLLVPYGGFFQANAVLVEKLVDSVVDACGPLEGATVLDCYCGSGLFSLFLASGAGRVVGCDVDPAAVRCAQENAERNGLANTRFYTGKVEKVLSKISAKKLPCVDTVILDPPRTGCDVEALDGIAACNPEKILYVSCNPATQARDIRRLVDRGYVLNAVQPFDMFPRTKHVEVLAILTSIKRSNPS